MRRRALLLLVMAITIMVSFAAPATAQYQPGQPGFILDPPQVQPNESTSVIGTGCLRNSVVTVTIAGRVVGEGVASDTESGAFVIPITAPGDSGDYLVTVTCGNTTLTQILTVVETACNFTITGTPGATVSASVPGFKVGTPYTLIFQSDPVQVGAGTIETDPQLISFAIPSNAAPGAHTLTIAGTGKTGQAKVLSCAATVLPAPVSGTLPRTGGDVEGLLRVGVLTVAAGGLLLLIARRSPRLA